MMDAEPVTAAAPANAAGDDERAAELVLARMADARVMAGERIPAKITVIVMTAALTAAGAWLRTLGPPPWQAVAGACLFVAALGWALSALPARSGRGEPEWVRAARTYQRPLPGRVPDAAMQVIQRYISGMSGRRWHGAYLYVPRCADPGTAHFGACHIGGTYPRNRRLLVILGEHLAAEAPQVIAGVLGHELRHVDGWRLRLFYLAAAFGLFGWVITGWAVPWPVLLAAVAGLRVVLMAATWTVEAACDLGSAWTAGAEAMLDAVAYRERVRAVGRAARPAWQRYADSILDWMAGPSHPPAPLRRALIRRHRERRA